MAKAKRTTSDAEGGNFVSEWFGQRIYPIVQLDAESISTIAESQCPFLSKVLGNKTGCVKRENSAGVCTINTLVGGARKDWLACPYRVVSSDIVLSAGAKIFGVDFTTPPVPVTAFGDEAVLDEFKKVVRRSGVGYFFFQDKLGGEISVSGTAASPEMAFDVTIVEVRVEGGDFALSRFGVLEIQTMDFHGTYKHAVKNLSDGFRLHRKKNFPETLAQNLDWASEGVEGPNIANVFKRTFYQILIKFELGGHDPFAGTVLAIPQSVWDSWQPFLGRPVLKKVSDKTYAIEGATDVHAPNAHICVFDLDTKKSLPSSPVVVKQFIQVSPTKLASFAFSKVPANMLKSVADGLAVLGTIKARVSGYWSDLSLPKKSATAGKEPN